MVGRRTQRRAGGTPRRSTRRTAASSAASSAGTVELEEASSVATHDNKEEAPSESELQVASEGGNEEDFTGNVSDAGKNTFEDDSFQETEDQLQKETEMEGKGTVGKEGEEVEECLDMEAGGEQLEETGGGDEDYLVFDMGEGDEQLEGTGEEGDEESFYVEEGDEQPEETGDTSGAEGGEYQQEMSEFDEVVDKGGGFDEDQATGDKEEKPEKPEAKAGTREGKVEDMSKDQRDDRTNEKEESDASADALKDKDTLVTTGEEAAEEKARIEHDKDLGWKWSVCIPPVFTGPCFDKNCFQYRIRIRQVGPLDLRQSNLIGITQLAHSTRYIYEHPDKVMELFVLGKNIEQLFNNILFTTFSGNHITITIERRQSSAEGEQSTSQLQELIKDPTDFTQVLNTVTFRQKNSYTRHNLLRKQGPPSGSVKHRSLFLHNLPPSIDKNFLRILFPLSQKAGLVNVSQGVSSAVLEMSDQKTAYHHLICFTDFFIDGRDIQMGTFDMSQEEALKEYNEKSISGKAVAKSERQAVQKYKTHTISAKEAQRREVENASSQAKNTKENQKTSAASSSSSSGDKASHSKGEEKSAGSKVDVKKLEEEKKEKERKERERKERERKNKERLEREKRERDRREREQRERQQQREQVQKGRNQRGGKQVPDRSRRTDGAHQPRRTDRAGKGQQDGQKEAEERELKTVMHEQELERQMEQFQELEREKLIQQEKEVKMQLLMQEQERQRLAREEADREFKRQKEAEERELKKITQELETQMYLERLQMEQQFQELERQKLIQQEKEVKMQLLMQEQEQQRLASEEAARKLQELEEQHRREREREQKRKLEQEREQERARERYREMERNREMEQNRKRERVHQKELERERAKQKELERERAKQKERAERMQYLHQQQGILQEEDQPARKRSRLDASMHEQGGQRTQMEFSAHQPRGGNQRSPSATATSGQGLLGSPQVSEGMHLKQSLEQEVAKQADELKKKLALLEAFQKDPNRVASELIQIDPSLATMSDPGSGTVKKQDKRSGHSGGYRPDFY